MKSNNLLEALKFVSSILKDKGAIYETHLSLKNNWITAFNGVLSIGHKILEDINVSPNAKLITEAIAKCGQNLSITQLVDNKLSIKSGKFKAIIPCVEPYLLQSSQPDINIAQIDDRFKTSLEQISKLISDDGQTIETASFLMNGKSIIGTNGIVIIEAWHGIDLPSNVSIPKALIKPILKTKKKLTGFGFSNFSVTFHFEDDSWIKTQNFIEQWRDVSGILDMPCDAKPLDPQFYIGLEAIAPFAGEQSAHFLPDLLSSHSDASAGAVFEISGLPSGPIFSIKNLMLIKELVKLVDFQANDGKMLKFYGDNVRGVVAGKLR